MQAKNKLFGAHALRKLFENKRFTIPFSVVAAFVFWLVIMISQNPDIERTFTDIPININLENTFVSENGMEIIGDLSSQKFSVTVDGPSYVVSALKSTDFYVYASAAAINEPGDYKLEVTGAKGTAVTGYEIVSVTPATVDVTVDYVETKDFTVKAVAEGATATEGLIAETAVVSGTESDTLTVKGPRTVINKIENAVAYAAVNTTLSASESFDAEIRLYDEAGEQIELTNLTLSFTSAKVTVPISKRVTVPVVADFSNLPSGFSKNSILYTVDHDTVTVIGTPATIDKITQITLSAIDITGISTSSHTFDVPAKLPDGVRLLDTIENFRVTIDTSGYAEKVFTLSDIRFENLGSGLSAKNDSVIRNIRICGPKAVINGLKDTALYAVADLADKAAGEHTVMVTVKSDTYHNIWQVGSYSTTVKITE